MCEPDHAEPAIGETFSVSMHFEMAVYYRREIEFLDESQQEREVIDAFGAEARVERIHKGKSTRRITLRSNVGFHPENERTMS